MIQKDKIIDTLNSALSNDEVPKIYANSFLCALGSGDIAIVLKNGIRDEAVLNLSYSAAKTLSLNLQELIGYLEVKSKNEIMTSPQIDQLLSGREAKKNAS